jgi:methionyl aminopeptidase
MTDQNEELILEAVEPIIKSDHLSCGDEEDDEKLVGLPDSEITKKKKKKKKKQNAVTASISDAETLPNKLELIKIEESLDKTKINNPEEAYEDDDDDGETPVGTDSGMVAAKKKKKKKNKKKPESPGLALSGSVAKVRQMQTSPPTIPICELFPDSDYPLGEILEHPWPKDLDR